MKKLVYIALALLMSNIAFAQYSNHFRREREKAFTFQVAPSVFNYNEHTVFGFHIGVNYKEIVNVSYFAMRDYNFGDSIKDYGWYGLNTAIMIPVVDKMGVGPVVRLANINGDWEKPYFGAEIRYDLSDKVKFGLEYGSSKGETKRHNGFGLKLIWNIK